MNLQEKPISEIEKELYEVLAPKHETNGCKFLWGGIEWIARQNDVYCERDGEGDDVELSYLTAHKEFDIKIIGHEPTTDNILSALIKLKHGGVFLNQTGFYHNIWNVDKKTYEPEHLSNYRLEVSFDKQPENALRALHKILV